MFAKLIDEKTSYAATYVSVYEDYGGIVLKMHDRPVDMLTIKRAYCADADLERCDAYPCRLADANECMHPAPCLALGGMPMLFRCDW